MLGMAGSCPAEDGWTGTPVPQLVKAEEVPSGCGYLQDDLSGGSHNLGRHIDDLAAQCRRVRFQRNNTPAHILFEGLKEEEGHEQREIKGGIGGKAFEGQHLRGEILESPMDQFITSPAVSLGNDRFSVEKMAVAGVAQLLIDSLAHAQVGVENAHWPDKLEQHLTILIEWAAEDGPAKLLPFSSPAAKLEEVPHLFAPSVPAPVALLPSPDMFLDVLVHLSGRDVSDAEFLKHH